MTKYTLMNDKVAKKIFKNSKVSKELTARIVSEILKIDYEDIYNNIRLISEEVYKGDEFMGKVVKEAKEIAGLDNLNLYFSEEEVQRLDREESYEKGYNAGIVQTKQEMVINLYNNNVPIEIISKSANLTTREVNEIIRNNENKSN